MASTWFLAVFSQYLQKLRQQVWFWKYHKFTFFQLCKVIFPTLFCKTYSFNSVPRFTCATKISAFLIEQVQNGMLICIFGFFHLWMSFLQLWEKTMSLYESTHLSKYLLKISVSSIKRLRRNELRKFEIQPLAPPLFFYPVSGKCCWRGFQQEFGSKAYFF